MYLVLGCAYTKTKTGCILYTKTKTGCILLFWCALSSTPCGVLFKSNCQYDHLLICVVNFTIKTNIKQGKSIIIHIYVRLFLLISLFIDIDTNNFEINIIFLFLSNLSDHKRYEKDYLLLYTINKKKHYLKKLIGVLNLGVILYLDIHIFKVNYL